VQPEDVNSDVQPDDRGNPDDCGNPPPAVKRCRVTRTGSSLAHTATIPEFTGVLRVRRRRRSWRIPISSGFVAEMIVAEGTR